MKKLPRHRLWTLAAAACLALAGMQGRPVWAQRPQSADHRPLSVGFLREGSDLVDAEIVLERLRRFMTARPALVHELVQAGFAADLELSPCDGPRDMEQRMNVNEFDLAFATAVVYARQHGDYGEPILMTSLPGDRKQPNEVGVLRRGVVIAGRGSSLFSGSEPSETAIREALAAQPLAVASSDSAASYIYPTLYLITKLGLTRPGEYWFCGTDAEVVKHVVSGLAPLGACREGELQALLPNAPEGKYYRILFRTDPFPTDPILLSSALMPERSALGSEIKLALRDFFKQARESPRNLTVENASGRSYENLPPALRLLERPAQSDRPAGSATPLASPVQNETSPSTGTLTIVPVMPAATPRNRPAMPPGLGQP